VDLKGVGCGNANWMHLAQGPVVLVNMAVKFHVL